MYFRCRSTYQEGRGLYRIDRFNLIAFLCLSQCRTWISKVICWCLFVCVQCVQLIWELIVRVCWWNCWQSLSKLPICNENLSSDQQFMRKKRVPFCHGKGINSYKKRIILELNRECAKRLPFYLKHEIIQSSFCSTVISIVFLVLLIMYGLIQISKYALY